MFNSQHMIRELNMVKFRGIEDDLALPPSESSATKVNYLLDAFAIVDNLTNPIDDEGDMPVSLPVERQNYKVNESNEFIVSIVSEDEAKGDFSEILESKHPVKLIASLGYVKSNAPYIRIAHREIKDDAGRLLKYELHLVSRPFMLNALEGKTKTSLFGSLINYSWRQLVSSKSYNLDAKSTTVENLLSILQYIKDDKLVRPFNDAPFKCHKGMFDLLNVVFNDSTNWHFHEDGYTTTEVPNIFDKLCNFMMNWQEKYTHSEVPMTIVCSGFSLGAMMTTILAPCIHFNFKRNGRTPPTVECRTLCGMKMGDKDLAKYVADYTPTVNCISEYDPVSCLPTNPEFSHVYPIISVRVHDSIAQILKEDRETDYRKYLGHSVKIFYFEHAYLKGLLNSKVDSLITMCINYVMGKSDNFKRYHLSAEEVVPRLLLNYSIEIMKSTPSIYFKFSSESPKILCNYFSSDNYAMKYGICPPAKCKFSEKDAESMKWICTVKQTSKKRSANEFTSVVNEKA